MTDNGIIFFSLMFGLGAFLLIFSITNSFLGALGSFLIGMSVFSLWSTNK